jgi:acyl-CoA dehydrogenase
MSDSDNLLTMILDQMGRLFGDLIDRDLMAAAERGVAPETLVNAIEQFGLLDALTVEPEDGGLSLEAAGAVFAMLGEHAVPLPIGETMIGRWLLTRAGLAVPDGLLGLIDLDREKASLAYGGVVGHIVAVRKGRLCLFAAADLEWQLGTSIAREGRQFSLGPKAVALAEAGWPAGYPSLETLGAMLRASQIAGALGKALGMAVDFANTRQQFGRPIGRFQAIQQLLAKLAAEAAAARAAADSAWFALAQDRLGWACAVAKIRAGEAARTGAAIAHQVHGAIGVTDEHMLHYITRRLWEWRLDFGSDGAWAVRLGNAARSTPAGLWNFIIARDVAPQPFEVFA